MGSGGATSYDILRAATILGRRAVQGVSLDGSDPLTALAMPPATRTKGFSREPDGGEWRGGCSLRQCRSPYSIGCNRRLGSRRIKSSGKGEVAVVRPAGTCDEGEDVRVAGLGGHDLGRDGARGVPRAGARSGGVGAGNRLDDGELVGVAGDRHMGGRMRGPGGGRVGHGQQLFGGAQACDFRDRASSGGRGTGCTTALRTGLWSADGVSRRRRPACQADRVGPVARSSRPSPAGTCQRSSSPRSGTSPQPVLCRSVEDFVLVPNRPPR